MANGTVEYKRLLIRFNLSNGQLAVGVEEASILEAVDNLELTSDGTVQQQATRKQSANGAMVRTAVAIKDYDFQTSTKLDLINKNDLNLYKYKGKYKGVDVQAAIGFPEINLSVNPSVKVNLKIDKPYGVSDLVGKAADLATKINNVLQDATKNIDKGTIKDENGNIIYELDSDQATKIVDFILTAEEVSGAIESVRAVLLDKTRLKKGHVEFSGDITGKVSLAASASGAYTIEKEVPLGAPILVPITGPIPIYLEFQLVGETTLTFDAKASVETAATLTVPVRMNVDVIDGAIQPLQMNEVKPEFIFTDPSFDGTQARLAMSAGVQVETGITVAKVISASIDPTVSMIFETDADVQGTVEQGCVDLDWDIYAQLSAEMEAEFSIFVLTWDVSTKKMVLSTLLKDEWPMDNYHQCWGESEPESDSDNDGVLDDQDSCPNTPGGTSVDGNGCPITNPVTTTWFLDSDGDGYGDSAKSLQSVLQPSGYVSNNTDADDADPDIYPGAPEICGDNVDNDQDGSTDEGCSSVSTSKIPDTGQTTSYTNVFGEDSDYNINPQSYTKLDANGNVLPDGAASWAMVRDNVTGLIWENKTDDGGIHDKDNTYTWQNAQDVFIAELNDGNFGGHSDWRMPTVKELSMLVNSDRYNPSINTNYFSNTVSSSYYWSSTTRVLYPVVYAWDVYFYNGYVSHSRKSLSYYVRAVRDGQ